MSKWIAVGVLGALSIAGCATLLGQTKRHDPDDVERQAWPLTSAGACDEAAVIDASSFFSGDYALSDSRPAEGTLVAIEGVPKAFLVCEDVGCEGECCDNGCGAGPCAYTLGDAFHSVCLDDPSYTCGGTDCSPICLPFSSAPANAYRFVGTIAYPKDTLGGVTLHVTDTCRIE